MKTRSLGDADARLRAILDQPAAGVMETDLHGRFLLVNQCWCDMLGYSEEELFARTIFDVTHPDSLDETRQRRLRLIDEGGGFVMEKQYVRKDGSLLWSLTNVSLVRAPDGRPQSIVALVMDISGRKRAEAQAAFLADLGQRLAPMTKTHDIVQTTVTALGGFLDAHRCYFIECLPSENRMVISDDWVRDAESSVAGPRALYDFGDEAWWQAVSRGDLAIADVAESPLVADRVAAYQARGVRSYAVQPLKRNGLWTTVLVVTDTRPRRWTRDELRLIENVVARTWPLVERARTEAALESSEARFRALFDDASDGIFVADASGRYTDVNGAGCAMLGYTRDELLTFSTADMRSPEPHAGAALSAGAILRGEVRRTERTFVRKDGTIFIGEIHAAQRPDGSLQEMVRDITTRKRVEEGLRITTERQRLLWEATAVLLTTEEPDAMMRALYAKIAPPLALDVYVNFMVTDAGDGLRLESYEGISDDEARGIARLDLGEAIAGTVALTRESLDMSFVQQSDDPRTWLARSFGLRTYTCSPLLAGQQLLGTLAFASRRRDRFDPEELEFLQTITRYVTVAYERLRLVRELRTADRKKDDFIALLAHELRNPLAPLRNGLQVMRLAGEDAAVIAQARAMMDRQLTHMVRLIDDLLDISRITLNKMELRRTRVRLTDVINAALETAREAIEASQHQLMLTLPEEPVLLDADLTRLAQVFSNLLTNSAKYTRPGGRIWVTAIVVDHDVIVTVADTGIGIPPEALPNIFDMFSQVDRSVERSTGGLGIGLALVKGLVSMHGGAVTAASDGQGRGTTFTVRLPMLERFPEAAAEPVVEVARPSSTRRRKILVVDDHRDSAESMEMMLDLLGNDVRLAHDGLEALELADRFRPDVILMDVGMPKMNGYEATRRIRQQSWGRGMIIVALTGWGQEADRSESHEAGCDRHLVKPIDPDDLKALLDELSERS